MTESESEDDLEKTAFGEEIFVAREDPTPSNVKMSIVIKGRTFEATADSGASRSLMATNNAELLKLRTSGQVLKFRGLGRYDGELCHPTLVHFNGKSTPVTFSKVEEKDFPILLGTKALGDLGILIDPPKRQL